MARAPPLPRRSGWKRVAGARWAPLLPCEQDANALIASAETYDAAVRLGDRRHRDHEIESTASLGHDLTVAVESAIEGEYETDDPPSRLTEFRDHVEFVRRDGVPDRFSGTFPRLVDPEPGLITNLRTTDVLRADGRSYHVDGWSLDHLPLSVTASATETGIGFEDPSRISSQSGTPVATRFPSTAERPGRSVAPSIARATATRNATSIRTEQGPSAMWPTISRSRGCDDEESRSCQRATREYATGGDAVGVPPGEYVVDCGIGTDRSHHVRTHPFRIIQEVE